MKEKKEKKKSDYVKYLSAIAFRTKQVSISTHMIAVVCSLG